jgi:hypothetical protein
MRLVSSDLRERFALMARHFVLVFATSHGTSTCKSKKICHESSVAHWGHRGQTGGTNLISAMRLTRERMGTSERSEVMLEGSESVEVMFFRDASATDVSPTPAFPLPT